MVEEDKWDRLFLLYIKLFNATNNIWRHRDSDELLTRYFATYCQDEELVAVLYVTEKTEIDSISRGKDHWDRKSNDKYNIRFDSDFTVIAEKNARNFD